jgi:hypothetical protein
MVAADGRGGDYILKVRQRQKVVTLLEEALGSARMERAGFVKPGGYITDDEYTKEVVATTRLYRESWIIGPLEEALKLIKENQ